MRSNPDLPERRLAVHSDLHRLAAQVARTVARRDVAAMAWLQRLASTADTAARQSLAMVLAEQNATELEAAYLQRQLSTHEP